MAVLGTSLIVNCFFFEMPLGNLPFIAIGAILVILYEFHRRIDGKIALGKFEASVSAENHDGQTEEMPAQSPHLRDVTEVEWRSPRRKRRG